MGPNRSGWRAHRTRPQLTVLVPLAFPPRDRRRHVEYSGRCPLSRCAPARARKGSLDCHAAHPSKLRCVVGSAQWEEEAGDASHTLAPSTLRTTRTITLSDVPPTSSTTLKYCLERAL